MYEQAGLIIWKHNNIAKHKNTKPYGQTEHTIISLNVGTKSCNHMKT